MQWIKRAIGGLGITLVLSLGALAAYAYYPEQEDITSLEKKYSLPGSHFENIAGLRAHYNIQGAGPDLILLHGNSSNLHEFDAVRPILAERFRVITVDLPGQGLTAEPAGRDYSIETFNRFIAAFVEKVQADAKVSIVGSSMGGYWAMQYAQAHAENVSKLVLASSYGGICAGRDYSRSTPLDEMPVIRDVVAYFVPKFVVRQILEADYYRPPAPDHLVQMFYDMLRKPGLRTFEANFSKYPKDRLAIDADRLLPVNKLIIGGEFDQSHDTCETRNLQERLQNAEFTQIKNVGHVPFLETPDAMRTLLMDFLTRTP
ncbi:alpha/beta hydrolase [Variovorax dokdonensis]|uniref:Alpha/beta hydrolase n=1 Tax=Variovorax dokdonensis TaxID=344883 RepID=A0ABT7N7E5_9BURK|nr:alpha/beta hydrolase [Variovorax dokdonensis]MDM0043857.1 alpha/beta hydrolase [Variovorax dokdonensis]